MAPASYRVWLVDIRTEISGIQELTRNADVTAFSSSWAMQRAVQHALLIISEATRHIPESLKNEHPQVAWRKIHALGNLLRHEYRRIDPQILWPIIEEHLIVLDRAVAALLEKEH